MHHRIRRNFLHRVLRTSNTREKDRIITNSRKTQPSQMGKRWIWAESLVERKKDLSGLKLEAEPFVRSRVAMHAGTGKKSTCEEVGHAQAI